MKSSKAGVQYTQYCARHAKAADCGLAQPCATHDHEWKKAGACSFVADIGLLVILSEVNRKKTKMVPAAVGVSIAAGAWWVVYSKLWCYRPYLWGLNTTIYIPTPPSSSKTFISGVGCTYQNEVHFSIKSSEPGV